MSNAHKSSRLLLNKAVVPIDEYTTFLAHYDITADESLFGISPIANVSTLRPYEGKYGGGIAIEEATTNLAKDGAIENLNTNYQPAWDISLNGTIISNNWGGYNGGVQSANVGYHAHVNIDRFGYPVYEFVDKNSAYGWKHRWIGMSQQIVSDMSTLGWIEGTKVTMSMDMMVDHTDKGMGIGLYHQNSANANGFYNAITSVYCSKAFEWQRVSATWDVQVNNGNWRPNTWVNPYVYGHYYKNDYEGIAWVKNIQIETKGFETSFVPSSRIAGRLAYPNILNQNSGTISFWFNMRNLSPSGYPMLFRVANNILEWVIRDTIIYVGNNGTASVSHSFQTDKWYYTVYTWDNTSPMKELWLFDDNGLIGKGSTTTNTYDMVTNQPYIYMGCGGADGSYVSNVIMDEVRIDSIKRTDEEIMQWYISQNPFFPKGVHRLAY